MLKYQYHVVHAEIPVLCVTNQNCFQGGEEDRGEHPSDPNAISTGSKHLLMNVLPVQLQRLEDS